MKIKFRFIHSIFLIPLFISSIGNGFVENVNATVIDFRLPVFHYADMKASEYFNIYDITVEGSPGETLLYHGGRGGFGVRYSYKRIKLKAMMKSCI